MEKFSIDLLYGYEYQYRLYEKSKDYTISRDYTIASTSSNERNFTVLKVVLDLKILENSNFFLLNFFIIYVVSKLKKKVWMKKF